MLPHKKIAVVEDDRLLRQQLSFALNKDYEVIEAGDRIEGERLLLQEKPELALVDLHMPPTGKIQEGMSLIETIRRDLPGTIIIVMSGDADMKAIQKAVDAGAYDFFKKPFDLTELKLIIGRALEKQRIQLENDRLHRELQNRYSFENMIGQSPPMLRVFDAIRRVADTPATVIIRGESGTGKELIARAIHYNSRRREKAFVSVNCAALPETLIESELFGHERGAFTGAVSARAGRFELAHGGTLFLDEIGSISLPVQAKLLRVLQERRFDRIGGTKQISADVRLITATNEDLEKKVKEEQFREDLYYRVHVFPIHVPPLRERTEDIPALLNHFLHLFCKENGIPVKNFDPDALQPLISYSWKGNVRELENLVQTLVLMSDQKTIRARDLPSYIQKEHRDSGSPDIRLDAGMTFDQAVEKFERQLLQDALQKAGGVKAKAAQGLGLDKNQMKYLSRKYDL